MLSNVHLVHDIPYKKKNYQALIEIPAGSTAKWEVNHITGNIEWEFKKDKPRMVKFIGYPGNYGFIPQSLSPKEEGGDGDPLDIIILGPSVEKGTVVEVKILGAIKLLDEGEQDDKILAIPLSGPFKEIDSIEGMLFQFPGVIEIVRYWFEGYKGKKISFKGYMKREKAKSLIEESHNNWSKYYNRD